jgi:hypothetical protein
MRKILGDAAVSNEYGQLAWFAVLHWAPCELYRIPSMGIVNYIFPSAVNFMSYRSIHCIHYCTDKKEKEIFLIYKEIQLKSDAKSYI